MTKTCVFEETKLCNNCMECETCELIPEKACDNCGKCIDSGEKYNTVNILEFMQRQKLEEKKKRLSKIRITATKSR